MDKEIEIKEEEETKYILWVTRNSNMYNWCIICMV